MFQEFNPRLYCGLPGAVRGVRGEPARKQGSKVHECQLSLFIRLSQVQLMVIRLGMFARAFSQPWNKLPCPFHLVFGQRRFGDLLIDVLAVAAGIIGSIQHCFEIERNRPIRSREWDWNGRHRFAEAKRPNANAGPIFAAMSLLLQPELQSLAFESKE